MTKIVFRRTHREPPGGTGSTRDLYLAVPVNQVPSSPIKAGGWVLPGGLDPLEAGSFDLWRPPDPASGGTVRLRTLTPPGLRVSLFHRLGANWLPLGCQGEWTFPVKRPGGCLTLSAVVELESALKTAVKPHGTWGFLMEAVCRNADGTESDQAELHFRIPPLLLASSADPMEALWVVRNFKSRSLVAALEELAPELGVALEVLEFPCEFQETILAPERANASHLDIWIQDAVALGRICVPAPGGSVQALAAVAGVRSPYPGMDYARLDGKIRALLHSRQVPVMHPGCPRPKARGIDWFGNLQVSPPGCDSHGRSFPHGRIITGEKGPLAMHPGVLGILEAQGVQTPPLRIDTSWLRVGHVDEVLAFVPVGKGDEFRVLVPSPEIARDILRRLVQNGHGDLTVLSGRKEETTVAALLHEVAETQESLDIEQTLGRIRSALVQGLGISQSQFIRLPALFQEGKAVIPNPINCVVCNDHLLVGSPEGPRVDGGDAFALDIQGRLEPLGKRVHFLDVWESLHIHNGGIHCATNAVRRIAHPRWWNSAVAGEPVSDELFLTLKADRCSAINHPSNLNRTEDHDRGQDS